MDAAGDDLHRLGVRAVAADHPDTPLSTHDHGVPCEQRLVAQGIGEALIQIHQHLGDAAFRRRDAPLVGGEAELLAQRGLQARAIEDFAFDFRGLQRLVADQLDLERVPVMLADMLEDADELAGAQQELPLQRLKRRRVEAELRPIRPLPVPGHDVWARFL